MKSKVLLADLPDAVEKLVKELQEATALTADISILMTSLPPLAEVSTYGNVRQTDMQMVAQVVDGIVIRVTIGLPAAVASIADDAAREMFGLMLAFHNALRLLDDYHDEWQTVLLKIANQEGVHGLIKGRACRILLDSQQISSEEAVNYLRLGISQVSDPAQSAAWVEGFLQGSGLILLHDANLLNVLDEWVMSLPGDIFEGLLPLLRRTFAQFDQSERKEIGRKIKSQQKQGSQKTIASVEWDETRADTILPTLAMLLGIEDAPNE